MQSKTKVFIVLGLLALLCVVGLGTNLFTSGKQKDADSYDREDSWVGNMDRLMAKFYPSLDPGRLVTVGNPCPTEGGGAYLLGGKESCKFFIKRKDGEKYQTATIKVDNRTTIRMAVHDKEDYSGECLNGPNLNALELMVDYVPAGESENDPDCWTIQKPDPNDSAGNKVRLVAMEKGGRLNISCPTCDQSKGRSIKVEIQ